jgi:hypothetical protein
VPFLAGQPLGEAELVAEVVLIVSDGVSSVVVVVVEVPGCSDDDSGSAVVEVDSSSVIEVDRVQGKS